MFEQVDFDFGKGPVLVHDQKWIEIWNELKQEEKNEKNIKKAPVRNELPARPDPPPLPGNRHTN